MGRTLSRYLPLDVAILSVIEFVLSFTVIIFTLDPPLAAGSLSIVNPLTEGTVSTTFAGGDLAAILASSIGGVVTLITGLRWPEFCLDRKRQFRAACLAGIVALPMFSLMRGGVVQGSTEVHDLWLTGLFGVWLAIIAPYRLLFTFTVRQTRATRRVLIVGDTTRVNAVSARLLSRRGRRFEQLVMHATEQSLDLLRQQQVWGVVVASGAEYSVSERLLDYKLRGMKVISDKTFLELYLGRIDPDTLTVNDLLLADGFATGRMSAAIKRGCDLSISVGMLILALPMMALAALAIKLDSPGPVFYRQPRVGRLGQPFTLLKFRSMTVNAEAGGKPCWAQKRDPRITKVGAFIRATHIDELPQLANVIRGEMSLVGPRPERPHFVEQLALAIPFYRERSYAKPGLTGWAQINFPYGASVEDAREKLAYDLYYAKHSGLLLDLFILISTVRVVLFREGAR
jgi:exopolysaccharide biosynthesis polyprenyl glycosylphosphotransferase